MALHRKSGVKNPPVEQPHYARDLNGAHRTPLAANLGASVIDPVADKIVASPNRPRGGAISADSAIKDQLRDVSSKPYPTTPGCRSRNGE
jgi:hypothetical protein